MEQKTIETFRCQAAYTTKLAFANYMKTSELNKDMGRHCEYFRNKSWQTEALTMLICGCYWMNKQKIELETYITKLLQKKR